MAAATTEPMTPNPSSPELAALGRMLREAREAAGVVQTQVRDLSGLSQSNISRLEAGELRQPPSRLVEIIYAYAEATGVPAGDLLVRWANAWGRSDWSPPGSSDGGQASDD